jgi:hypothetical protein
MSVSLKKLWNDYGVAGILFAIIAAYVLQMMYKYFMNKGSYGYEGNSNKQNKAYNNRPAATPSIMPASENQTGEFASTNGSQQAGSCGANMNSPSDMLPRDTNSEWTQLNPAGKGDLANINLLKAGYHIGIDTIGQTLRNANLQIRSEPPNPQLSVGPWNQSTITPDFLRPPLQLGQGGQ